MSAAVLIVEDDELIASSLVRALQSQGYAASSTGTVSSALDSIAGSTPDLVLLDLGLPDGDGSAVATRMALEHPRVPVIALTARSDEIDIVLGLESGAVDYIVKPFHLAELLARIRAHLRFAESARSDAGRRQVVAGDVVIDAAARRAFVGTDEIALRPKEFDLIHRLAVDAGLVVTREQLIDDVWDDNWWGSTKTLDVHVNSIRRKLGEQPGQPSRISTIRGVGYRLELECRAAAARDVVRRRILITIVSVTLAAVCAFFIPAALAIRSSTRRGDSLDVERDAAIVASQIPPAGPVDVAELQPLVGAERQLGVYDSAVGLVDGNGPTTPDAFTRLALAGEFAEGWADGNLVAAVPVRSNTTGPSTVVRIEEPASVSRIRIERSLALLALIGAAIVGTAAMIGVLLTRRLAKPVERLTRWATHADDEPAPPPTTGISELDELRDALVDERGRVDAALSPASGRSRPTCRTSCARRWRRCGRRSRPNWPPRPDPTSLLHEGLGAVDRLEATITSLLALARRAEGEPVLCDAAAVVADQVDRWRPTLAAHGRDIGVGGAPLIISIDPATVRHIVDVLIENAFRHGSGMIEVRIERGPLLETGRRELVIDVGDDGSVAPGADPFTAQPPDSGRGIGLRLARTLAESSGGCLDLQTSSPTRFRLRLPERGGVYPTLSSV